jgi:hypothetical protein
MNRFPNDYYALNSLEALRQKELNKKAVDSHLAPEARIPM